MAAKPQPMCAVTIGFETYLLPSAAGMKLVDLMQQALACERDFGIGNNVTATGPVDVHYRSVRPDQITMPPGSEVEPARRPSRPKAITQQSLRLTRKD
ncbi:hypothetical protein [Zoogloea sp. 1C4]|uniref:hypothetical protein n=1 Tax=Zoogloea sp. 1C4 TaxID=2570190 RepID=UPI0012917859|nr:hypothetical protein [Zoogloea sp. 1C4]